MFPALSTKPLTKATTEKRSKHTTSQHHDLTNWTVDLLEMTAALAAQQLALQNVVNGQLNTFRRSSKHAWRQIIILQLSYQCEECIFWLIDWLIWLIEKCTAYIPSKAPTAFEQQDCQRPPLNSSTLWGMWCMQQWLHGTSTPRMPPKL